MNRTKTPVSCLDYIFRHPQSFDCFDDPLRLGYVLILPSTILSLLVQISPINLVLTNRVIVYPCRQFVNAGKNCQYMLKLIAKSLKESNLMDDITQDYNSYKSKYSLNDLNEILDVLQIPHGSITKDEFLTIIHRNFTISGDTNESERKKARPARYDD